MSPPLSPSFPAPLPIPPRYPPAPPSYAEWSDASRVHTHAEEGGGKEGGGGEGREQRHLWYCSVRARLACVQPVDLKVLSTAQSLCQLYYTCARTHKGARAHTHTHVRPGTGRRMRKQPLASTCMRACILTKGGQCRTVHGVLTRVGGRSTR